MSEEKTKILSQQSVSIQIDGQRHSVARGYTLATAITHVKGISYRQTRFGDPRGPVCNMGVCFECSIYLEGQGNIRACMVEIKEGMAVHTTPDFNELPFAESPVEETLPSVGLSNQEEHYNEETSGHTQIKLQQGDRFDVAIVGSGPAGLAAAEELSNQGLKVVIIDEQQTPGGQIYRYVPDAIRKKGSFKANALVQRVAEKQDLYWVRGNTVWSISPVNEDGEVAVGVTERASYQINFESHATLQAKQIIIATGAYDRLFPFKGWTKPGVMSAGGLQIFSKTQHFLPGKDILLAGSHPFLLIVAKQILQAGGNIKGIAFAQGFPKLHELFSYGLSGLRRWKKSKELLQALVEVRKRKIPLWFNTIPVEAEGKDRVTQIKLARWKSEHRLEEEGSSGLTIQCDTVGLCYGFTASSELARQLGCQTRFDSVNGGWLVQVNEVMQSTVENIWVAGELTGIGGAELSEIEGRISALAILRQLKPEAFSAKKKALRALQTERASWQQFAQVLAKATDITFDLLQLLEKEPTTYVCRCEEISYETLKATLEQHPHVSSMNAIKLMTRCGMGLCQGRYCERTLYDIGIQYLGTRMSDDSLTVRFPVKPTTIKQMITMKDNR